MKGSKTMKENTNNKYAEFDTIVKEVTRELPSSVLIHPAKETFETMAIHGTYAHVLDIFATIDINMPNEKLTDMMHNLRTLWATLLANDCFKCDNSQSITRCIDRMLDIARDKVCETDDDKRSMIDIAPDNKSNNEEDKSMKANVNNGSIFNKAAYVAQCRFECAVVHEDKAPINEVWKVCETLNNFRKVLFKISIRGWDTTSMESLHQLKDLILDASDMWTYICALDEECVECDRYIIQAEINFMIERVSEEICIHHLEEYMTYINNDNKTSTDSDVDTETSDDSQSESDDKESSSILGTIKPISNNHVHKSPIEVYQAMKLTGPFDGGLIDWDDIFKHAAYVARHVYPKENSVLPTNEEHVEKKTRPSKDEYYLGIAEAVSARSTCLRIHYGSIICNNDRIVSSGYNGAPMGAPNCDEVGECYRVKNNIPHFTRYETCQSVHSEMNAIINASRTDMLGGTLYLVGKDVSSGSYVEGDCCPMCRRAVINAGISQVVFRTKDGGIRKVNVSDWTNDCMFNND